MSSRATQFDAEKGRPGARSASQTRSRTEGRYENSREGRGSHRALIGTSDVELTEVGILHKKAYGKTSEKTQLRTSKARTHGSHVSNSTVIEGSQQSLDYASPHLSGRSTQDHSLKANSSPYASTAAERTIFMDNIPGIPANEQLTQRGDRAGRTLFPPPSVSNYGQNVTYPTGPSSDVKSLPRDPNNTSDLVFSKAPTNRHSKSTRLKSQEETEMQWNATQENSYRPRDEQRNRPAVNEFHYARTSRGRRNKDGANVVYNDVKFSGSSRQNVSRRSASISYSESPTDSQGSSTESESDISSSPDTSLKRRRRIRRKPSNKSIGSSMYGEDNTSESENQSISEFSDTNSTAHSLGKRQGQFASEERIPSSFVSYKEQRSAAANKIRSSSLTSVSSLEGAGITGDSSRIQSPLTSPKGNGIAKVRKVQIRSFTSFADSHLYNKENQPQRRRSLEEREPIKKSWGRVGTETTGREQVRVRPSLTRQGSESPSLSKSPFSLKSKPLGRKTSKDSHLSDSESNCSYEKGKENSTFDKSVSQEQEERCNSAPPAPSEIATRDFRESRLHSSLPESGLASLRSAFVPIKPSKRTHVDHQQDPSLGTPVSFADLRAEKGVLNNNDIILQPVPRHGNRPLSIVQETDEFVDLQNEDTYVAENVEKLSKKSHLARSSPIRTSQDLGRTSSPTHDDNKSKLRRLSYVRAQKNATELPNHSPDLATLQPSDIDSNSDSSPTLLENFSGVPSLRMFNAYSNNDTRKALKEFDPSDPHEIIHSTNSPVVAEGDLITFDDENGDVKEPVKKRQKKISRPKIPTILSGVAVDCTGSVQHSQGARGMVEENDISYNKELSGLFDESNSGTVVAHESGEDSTPRAASDVEENETVDALHFLGSKKLGKGLPDSLYDTKNTIFDDGSQKVPPHRRQLKKRASLPLIKTEFYHDEVNIVEEAPKLDVVQESPSLRKAETITDLSLDQMPHHLGVISYNSGDMTEFQDDKSLKSCSPPLGPVPSPSPSQISFDALSLTTSGFSETHSDQVSTGDLNAVDDLLGMDATGNMKSLDAWRSQSDPSHGTQLEDTIAEAELQAHRNSNSEPNLSGEKLKEEAEKLAKRVNGGSQGEPIPKTSVMTKGDDDDKETLLAELSPDDGCYDLDKPERRTKPVQRAKSAPAPTTPTSPRPQRIANSFAVEKAQAKLNKLSAMETIMEMPHAEPSIEKPKVEKKRSPSVEGSCTSPNSPGVPKEDKRKLSVPKEPGKSQKSKHDLRAHVLKNLVDTEMSYVQNLQFLVLSYYKALKKQENSGIVEPAQVDEMFYQIPEILLCHEFFLQQLQARVSEWHDKQKIGDIFVSSFTKCFLVDAYSAFINHFLQARAAVRVATVTRPAFVRYMEQCSREHKEKLTLQDLMIMPVQRIPRYELILKDMIKHTPHDHPDHGSLQLALGEIKTLADRMNRGEKEVDQAEREADRLRELEGTIEGMTNLVTPTRRLIRQDLVAEVKGSITKKDRCLFLFNDLLVCATVKRKANALRRGSLSIFSGSGTEFNKYKLLWKLHLDDVEIYKSSPEAQRRNSLERQLEKLDNDMSLLSRISSFADTLTIAHMALDGAIRELMNEVNRQISEKQIPLQPPTSTKLELHVTRAEDDGPEEKDFQFLFLETEIKNSWEAYFEDAKQKLAYAKDTFPPEFQYCIPINKTRSGMQYFVTVVQKVMGLNPVRRAGLFTCSSPSQVPHMLDRGNHNGSGDVWVCNSDGYVGQGCILRMGVQIQPFGSITVCMSRILCISPVPGTKFSGLEALQSESETKADTHSISMGSEKSSKANTTPKISRSGYASDEDVTGPQSIMAFDSSSEDEEGLGQESFLGGKFNDASSPFDVDGRLSPEGSSLGTIGSADGLDSSQDENVFEFEENYSSGDEIKEKGSRKHSKRRMGSSRTSEDLKDSLSDIVNFDTDEPCTVWLGTEDGCIFVYPAKEAQNKKSKLKLQLSGSIQCILYVDNQVFISLSTGDLYIYRRQPGCAWEVGSPVMLHIGESTGVSCMTAIHGRLWCGLGCNAVIVNTTTLEVETSFNCSLDKDRSVYRMASSGMGVWISLQSSATVRLFHATRYECLADVDVAPPVHKMLQGSDAIIRQHKAACLRVTALLACKDLLWIGTSAGVVLTLPLPTITASTASLRNCPSATASFHGHTGHVRFLTAVEAPKEGGQDNTNDKSSNSTISTSSSTANAALPPGTSAGREVLIISGGDGYEDFRTSSASESAGRDDSTNHLLIWRV